MTAPSQTPAGRPTTEQQESPLSDTPDNSGTLPDDAGALELTPLPQTGSAGEQSVDPLWYQRAVFYEVLIRGFADSNGDGTGDIRGLTSKLDYLQWLGIDCLWLLPIYQS